MVARKDQFQKALDKAQAMGGTRLIVSAHNGRYTVRGSVAPTTYTVALGLDGELHCDDGGTVRRRGRVPGGWSKP